MSLLKKTTNLRDQYAIHLEIGLVLSLALLIVAFHVDLSASEDFRVRMEEQETISMKQVQQTQQEKKPPPPPRPPVPVEVPNNQVIEQQDVNFDASLDMDQALDTNLGPPPEEDAGPDEEKEPTQEIFVAVEEQPELIGGMEALQEDVEYPEFARRAGLQGRVFVEFVVDKNGNVTNPTIKRGVHRLLDKAAIEAVKKQKFRPGRQRGDPVKVRMALPVVFRLKK